MLFNARYRDRTANVCVLEERQVTVDDVFLFQKMQKFFRSGVVYGAIPVQYGTYTSVQMRIHTSVFARKGRGLLCIIILLNSIANKL